ncbi:MAG TPA: antibiotic biosynthesis monooxygenase, partial [Phototrophicaceae bacterium]|nr:antibiotic biosynthesis monooxygenase [Phototrophicaceae bacterium]
MLALDVKTPSQPIPADPHYMILPIDQGFDWAASFEGIAAGDWYLVVFRSKHRAGANEALLTDLDNAASESARELSGFLHYFIGTPLASGECLSFCLWNSREEAAFASAQPAHREAVMKGIAHYEDYALERYAVRKWEGVV